jgi:hypothetical protein
MNDQTYDNSGPELRRREHMDRRQQATAGDAVRRDRHADGSVHRGGQHPGRDRIDDGSNRELLERRSSADRQHRAIQRRLLQPQGFDPRRDRDACARRLLRRRRLREHHRRRRGDRDRGRAEQVSRHPLRPEPVRPDRTSVASTRTPTRTTRSFSSSTSSSRTSPATASVTTARAP